MSTTATTTATNPFAALSQSSTSSSSSTKKNMEAGSQDRFLTLLVAQMQNQDPLNPTDNAQITSQMAQINTVTGLEKVNDSIAALNAQFMRMQALQGASLVGNTVVVAGNKLTAVNTERTQFEGGFEIGSAADQVKVDILNGAGHVLATMQLGTQAAGRHTFQWANTAGIVGAESFRVTATSGAANVTTTALMSDLVESVSTSGQTLQLQLTRSGTVNYDAVKAFN
ncbi:flagellar hook assembly protein FlgD [Azohydromonas caseinilytica]|uniref:Basal-body rod modification protein FlgD n=1 Tax=Azohydromonas caseinilytica TaxID=2728836 RepID=A0A848F862_9BURK|nr:flagellar hook capping FlgD N-terminal domain-containing protein [Azohydromonas caseinilytica]NML14905.1 flagellar hook assembly protein FlgD [Azohydromonas caseinilytica]